MNYSYLDCQLKIGEKQIIFLSPIKDVLEVNGLLLVLLRRIGVKLDPKESMNSNVLAFDLTGEKVWSIQESPTGGERDKPYTAIYIEDNKIIAYNGLGFEYELNLADGGVIPLGNRPW